MLIEFENDLISKKDLLQKYNISYGALYRWKRKGLIPDDWFIRKSTPTGQETYFNKAVIFERIEEIIRLKEEENVALEDMESIFYPEKESQNVLTVSTKYGEKTYKVDEITSINLKTAENENIDILKFVKENCHE